MTETILTEDDRVEWAIKAFRRKVQRSGILKDLRQGRYYVKPSTARRLKAKAAQRPRSLAAVLLDLRTQSGCPRLFPVLVLLGVVAVGVLFSFIPVR